MDAKEVVAADFFFSSLLQAQRVNADDVMVRGIKAFHIADGNTVKLLGHLVPLKVFGERHVRAGVGLQLVQHGEGLVLRIWGWRRGIEFALTKPQSGSVELIGFEGGLLYQGPELGRATVDELCAEFDKFVVFADGKNPPADSGAGLKESDASACFCKSSCGCKTSYSGPDNDDVGG